MQNEKLRDELDNCGGTAKANTANTNPPGITTFDLIEPLKDVQTSLGASQKVNASDGQSSSLHIGDSTTNKRRWNPPMLLPLPPNFLRLSSNEVKANEVQFNYIRINFSFFYCCRCEVKSIFQMNNLL